MKSFLHARELIWNITCKEGSTQGNNEAALKKGYQAATELFHREVLPSCSGPSANNTCADATLEEIWHTITDLGYAKANSTVFSTDSESDSLLTKAMDVARGGRFLTIPDKYPSGAWYTYTPCSKIEDIFCFCIENLCGYQTIGWLVKFRGRTFESFLHINMKMYQHFN